MRKIIIGMKIQGHITYKQPENLRNRAFVRKTRRWGPQCDPQRRAQAKFSEFSELSDNSRNSCKLIFSEFSDNSEFSELSENSHNSEFSEFSDN